MAAPSFCCENMRRWSESPLRGGAIVRSHAGTMTGIRMPHEGWVSIAFCPWCGAKVSEVDPALIGRRITPFEAL